MIYVSCDIETTGLDPKKHDIVEIGAVIDDLSTQRPIDSLPVFHCYVLPPDGNNYTGSPFALSMHPTIFRRIANRDKEYTYVHPNKVGFSFKKFLLNNGYVAEHDMVTINAAGKNFAAFDLQFLQEKTDITKHVNIRHRIIDPAILYVKDGDDAVPGTSDCLKVVKSVYPRINTDVAHTAVEDAKDVIRLVRYGLRNVYGEPSL